MDRRMPTDARVEGNGLVRAIREFVASFGSLNADVIDERLSDMGDFVGKGKRDIAVHNLRWVGVTHWYDGET